MEIHRFFLCLNCKKRFDVEKKYALSYNTTVNFFYYIYKKGGVLMRKELEHWLNQKGLDDALRDELESMSEEALEEAFYKPLSFGTGGMRGILGAGINRMNKYTLRKAAYGFGKYLIKTYPDAKERGVTIAYDNRHQSDAFAKVCVEVLAAFGIPSYLFENLRPTPLLSYAVRSKNACGGIMVTASHNPPNYNGFKIYDEDGCQLIPKEADKVVEYVNQVDDLFTIESMPFDMVKEKGLVTFLDRNMDTEYLNNVAEVQLNNDLKKTVKIVFTPLHGASREIGLRSLVENGFEVIPVEEQMVTDANFSTVKSPNPEDPKAFEHAVKYGLKHQADVLIATDPDGDRLGVAVYHNKAYHYLTGNQTGAIFIEYLLSNLKDQGKLPQKGIIYNTIVTSDFGASIARTYGVKTESTLTGFKFIGEQMKAIENTQTEFLMGYEESYGYVIKDFVRDKDSIQAMLLVSEIANVLKRQGKTLIDYLNELYEKYGAYREDLVNIVLEGKAGEEKIQTIMDHFRTIELNQFVGLNRHYKEDYLSLVRTLEDGNHEVMNYPQSNVIKFIYESNTWFVLRPSGTEPKLKIYIAVKSDSIEQADQRIAMIKETLLNIIDTLLENNEEVKK